MHLSLKWEWVANLFNKGTLGTQSNSIENFSKVLKDLKVLIEMLVQMNLCWAKKKEGGSIAFNAYHQLNSQLQTPIYNQRPGRSHKRTITTESTKKVNTGILVREQEITSTFQALQSSWSCPCGEKSWESFYESKLSGRASGSFVWFSSWWAQLRKLPPYIYIYISDTTHLYK